MIKNDQKMIKNDSIMIKIMIFPDHIINDVILFFFFCSFFFLLQVEIQVSSKS